MTTTKTLKDMFLWYATHRQKVIQSLICSKAADTFHSHEQENLSSPAFLMTRIYIVSHAVGDVTCNQHLACLVAGLQNPEVVHPMSADKVTE